jgi:hypothetical protein
MRKLATYADTTLLPATAAHRTSPLPVAGLRAVHTAANRHQAKATDVGRARPHLGVEGVINSASYMTRVNSTFGIASEGLAIVEGRAEP